MTYAYRLPHAYLPSGREGVGVCLPPTSPFREVGIHAALPGGEREPASLPRHERPIAPLSGPEVPCPRCGALVGVDCDGVWLPHRERLVAITEADRWRYWPTCPTCGAAPGRGCTVVGTDRRTPTPHKGRRDAAA